MVVAVDEGRGPLGRDRFGEQQAKLPALPVRSGAARSISQAQRIISPRSGIGSSSPIPVSATGTACSRWSTSTDEAATSSGRSRGATISIRSPSLASISTKGRPSMTGSADTAGIAGTGSPRALSAAMIRPWRATSAGPEGRAPGGVRRRT